MLESATFQFSTGLDFQSWITQNGKSYKQTAELEARARIFGNNARLVEEHNSRDTTFRVRTSTQYNTSVHLIEAGL
jgi:hypothetical protein